MSNTQRFIALRDHLLHSREELERSRRDCRWPAFEEFNWVGDYFDVIAADNSATALRMVDDAGADSSVSYFAMARPGTRRRRSSPTTTSASTRARCWTNWSAAASPPSVRHPPSGACS